MDTLKSIRIFTKIVDLGSLTAAAADMGISLAMVSKHLNYLEGYVGARLIQRTTRSLCLTDEGREYHEHCQIALKMIDELKLNLGANKGVPHGTLRIAVPRMIELTTLQGVIADYVRRHPQMKLDVIYFEESANLIEDKVDLVLQVAQRLPASSMIARRLAPFDQVVCVSPDYIAKHGRPQVPQDMVRHLALTHANPGRTWSFFNDDGEHEVRLDRHIYVDTRLACSLALSGVGIAVLPTDAVAEHVQQGRLEVLFPEFRLPEQFLYVVYPSRRHLASKVRAFIDVLTEPFAAARPLEAGARVVQLPGPEALVAEVALPNVASRVQGKPKVPVPYVAERAAAERGSLTALG